MTLSLYNTHFREQLQSIYSKNEAGIITQWVWESLAGISESDLLKNDGGEISEPDRLSLDVALNQLLLHKPVQYVTGDCWFYKMNLKVNEDVLIPRPETEELVELIIKENEIRKKENLSILDIGTGSGCIAIALKKHLPFASITAIDSSSAALNVAKNNAAVQETEITFIQFDFLDEQQWTLLPVFDIIVSNPPYIPINEMDKLDINVTAFEPPTALFVPNENPLLFYEKIAAFKNDHLNTGGKIFMETHESYARETAVLFEDANAGTLMLKDISGKDRMIKASY